MNLWDEALNLEFLSLLLAGRARGMYSRCYREAKNNHALLKAAMTRCFEPLIAPMICWQEIRLFYILRRMIFGSANRVLVRRGH